MSFDVHNPPDPERAMSEALQCFAEAGYQAADVLKELAAAAGAMSPEPRPPRLLCRGIELPFVLNEVGRAWMNMAVHGYDYFGARVAPRGAP